MTIQTATVAGTSANRDEGDAAMTPRSPQTARDGLPGRTRPEWLATIDDTVTVLKGQGRYGIVTRLLRLRAALAAATPEPPQGRGSTDGLA